jgi:hypothetical protein
MSGVPGVFSGLRLPVRDGAYHAAGTMKTSGRWQISFLALLLVSATGCANRTTPVTAATATAVVATTPAAQGWVRTELYFALGGWEETALSTKAELSWAEFLDAEVTPRFPDGLSVVDVYGQWRSGKAGSPLQRERSRLLVIVHPATAEASAKIEAIRNAWKQRAGEQSVLRVSQPSEVSF